MRSLEHITLLRGPPWNLVKKSGKVPISYWKLWFLCSHGWTTITKINFLSSFSAVWPKILHLSHLASFKYYVDDWKSIFWENNPPTPSTTVRLSWLPPDINFLPDTWLYFFQNVPFFSLWMLTTVSTVGWMSTLIAMVCSITNTIQS